MARKYPKFLWSDPNNTKSQGPFIIHTQHPRFLVKVYLTDQRFLVNDNNIYCEVWEDDIDEHDWDVQEALKLIPNWFEGSGQYQSAHPDDKIICALRDLDFFKSGDDHFSVEEARHVIRILFPTKADVVFKDTDSYAIKHHFEHLSIRFGKHKGCSNSILIEAFEQEGFLVAYKHDEYPNPQFNILRGDWKACHRLFG